MTDPAPNPRPPGPDAPLHMIAVEPDAALGPPAIAAELVVHALLLALHSPDPAARRARIDRAIAAVRAEPRHAHHATAGPRSRFRLPRQSRWALAAAALLTLTALIIILGIPAESAALAEVRQSIAALRSADHRYEVRFSPWDAPPRPGPSAVIDMRAGAPGDERGDAGGGLLLVEHWPPWSRTSVFVGRDASGEWAIRPDGTVERTRARQYWPPWSVDDRSLIVDSVDKLLTQLEKRYSLQRPDRAPLPAPAGTTPDKDKPQHTYDHVTAARRDREGPLPHYVELWIDPATSLPERVEMRWDPPDKDDAADLDNTPPPPHDDWSPPPHGEGPPPPDVGEGHQRPPPPDDDRDFPPPPPDGRQRPPHHRPHPPKLIVLEHVPAPAHTDDWFTPEAHIPKPKP